MERGSRRIGRWCIAIGLLSSGTLIALPAGVVLAEGYEMWPSDEQRVLYMAPTPNNLPGSGLIPYPITVPVGELFFDGDPVVDGDEDPITGFDRHIEVDTTEDAATCNASRATEPEPSYIGCSSIKLNVSHGDLKVGGAFAAEVPAHTEHGDGAYVQTTINNTAADGDANDSFELYIRGLEAEINAALADLSYVPADGFYHTGDANDIERLDLLLSTAQGSIADDNSRSVYIRVMDVNDWPEVTAPPDPAPIDAAGTLAFGDLPATPDEGTVYTGTKFHTTDEDNDDGTQEDDDDEGDDPKRDGPYDDSLVVMWTTCGSFEITNKNTFTVSEHLDELIDAHFNALYADYEDLLDNPAFAAAIEAMNAAIEQGLDDAGLDETLLATQSEWTNERIAGFAGLASDMPGVLDAFDEVTFFAREPGSSSEGAYLEGMTCEMYALVSDLGNNGLPLASAGFFEYYTGTYDIAAPFPGFDWDSVEIEIEDGVEIDISFDTTEPLYVTEGNDAVARLVITPSDHPGFEIEWSLDPRVGDPVVLGQATANDDFLGTFGNSIVVPALEGEIPILAEPLLVDPPNISPYDDLADEGNETFTFSIDTSVVAPPPGYTITSSTPSRQGIIVDNDDTPAAVSMFADVSGPEGDLGDSNVLTFTIGLGTPADGGETVDVVLTPGSATTPEDYGPPDPLTVVFGPGDTSATFDVPIVGDDDDEGNHTFTAMLQNATGGLTITDATATGTIEDDDAPATLDMLSDASVTEGQLGVAFMAFTLTLDQPAEGDESVTFEVTPGTATAPDDYSVPASLDVAWVAGELEATFLVPVHGDTLVEGDHGFTVSIVGSENMTLGADITATGTILDDDLAFDLPPTATVAEGASGSITVTISPATHPAFALGVTLTPGTADAGSDFDASASPFSVPVPIDAASVAIPIAALGDLVADDGETYSVVVVPESIPPGFGVDPPTATSVVTITDVSPGDSVIDVVDLSVSETSVVANVTVTNSFPARDCAVTVTTTGASATAGADFTSLSATPFTADGVATIDVALLGDVLVEGDETFTVAVVLDGGADPACILGDGSATVTITDDDEWADVSIADATVTEDPAEIDQTVISMTNWVAGLECALAVTSGDVGDTATAVDDYDVVGPGAVFNLAMTSDVLGLGIADDVLVDPGETFTLSLALDGAADPRCRLLDGTATVTITDDDEWADVSIADATVTEDPGEIDQAVISMTNWVAGLECALAVSSGDAGDTATAVDDYDVVGPGAVFLLPMASDVLSLGIVDDLVDDDAETFTLTLVLDGSSDPRCRLADSTATVTITDDDGPPPDETAPTVTLNQAGSQGDPTSSTPIVFTVVFNEEVTGFETGDVSVGGTAGATTAVVTDSGDSMTFSVAVSGMTGDGTVIASVLAGVAEDAASNANLASTSTDNVVTYVVPAPGTLLTLTAPPDITVPNDPGMAGAAVVFGPATAGGGVPPIDIDCSHDSGDFFPLGTTSVMCTATDSEPVDSDGERFIEAIVSVVFTITVLDVEPPVIADAPDRVVPATSSSGAAVTYVAPAATDNAGPPTVVCVPASGLTYPIGATTVTCTATDAAGNSASSSFTITVTPPGSGPTPPPTTAVPTGTLPPTGGSPGMPGLVAVGLVALGLGLVASSRTRSRSVNGV